MSNSKVAGVIVCVLILMISTATALDYFGNSVEKIIQFLTQITTFLVIISLFSIWKKSELIGSRTLKILAVWYPFIGIVRSVYPVIEYSEQTIPTSYIYAQSLELLLALFIAGIFLQESKR